MSFFWWSWRRSGGCGGGGGWVGPTVLLCVYGFCSLMRPVEPFLTAFFTGPYKNLTTRQVTRQVFPVWTYSNLLLLIPALLVTDYLRYKPVIVLQGLCQVASFLLILLGEGLASAQWAIFIYSIATAADVAYFSYIYSVVQPQHYQRVTSYARAAVLVGYAAGGSLAQLLVSLGGVSLYCLTIITVFSACTALLTSLFLPMPPKKKSLFFTETRSPPREGDPGAEEDDAGSNDTKNNGLSLSSFWWTESISVAMRCAGGAARRLLWDCRKCYSSPAVLSFSMWFAAGRCGFYQVTGYVQILWADTQPDWHNFTAYNGAVDSVATLSGAVASVAVGHVSLDWTVWGELVLGGFSVLIAGAVYLMVLTHNIWLCYGCYVLFKVLYMQLITICTFQIARQLSRERYALVFGINSFVGTVLQSVLTAVVINTESLQLTILSQFFIYASYFAVLALLFLARGVYTAHRAGRRPAASQGDQSTSLPEVTTRVKQGSHKVQQTKAGNQNI